jgi:hypothetical protein
MELIATKLVTDVMDLALPEQMRMDDLLQQMANHINRLAAIDFEQLVNLLYRIDVNEDKLRYLLQQHKGENTGLLIAELIVQRQLEKAQSRREHGQHGEKVEGVENW